MRTNLRPSARAIDFPSEVFPTPGGPRKFLHLFEVVVILVEDGLSLGNVNLFRARGLAPRQGNHPFKIRPGDHVFGGSRSHFRQPLQLAIALLEGLRGHSGLFHLLAKLVDFRLAVVGFAQLFVDGLELLAQQILTLALAHLFLHLFLDLVAQFQNLEFLGELANQRLETPPYVGRFEQLLPKQRREIRQICRDEIGQAHRIINVERRGLQVVGQLRRARNHVAKQLASVAFERH